MFQHLVAPSTAVNMIAFRAFGLFYGCVTLRGDFEVGASCHVIMYNTGRSVGGAWYGTSNMKSGGLASDLLCASERARWRHREAVVIVRSWMLDAVNRAITGGGA